jgi:hypothetical protein
MGTTIPTQSCRPMDIVLLLIRPEHRKGTMNDLYTDGFQAQAASNTDLLDVSIGRSPNCQNYLLTSYNVLLVKIPSFGWIVKSGLLYLQNNRMECPPNNGRKMELIFLGRYLLLLRRRRPAQQPRLGLFLQAGTSILMFGTMAVWPNPCRHAAVGVPPAMWKPTARRDVPGSDFSHAAGPAGCAPPPDGPG